ncbi:IS3 family transposase [Raoultibacter massiliensis]|uniref:IS3 family transposase n=1 Tax=Raoultibacter massiliensis TaxID=1852371 RepID=A0ABV1JAN9_9ACTN
MYSREEKTEIVEAFLASGLTAAEAGRRPGWPSRRLLAEWVDQARRGEIAVALAEPAGHVGDRKRHERHSDETKARAVALYERGRRPAEIARLLGIDCRANVRAWWKKARESGKLAGDAFAPKPIAREGGKGARMAKKQANGGSADPQALEAALLENQLLRAVLDDLKEGSSNLDSISNRKKAELGERLRRDGGPSLREITAFLRISKSSYEYHRARLDAPDALAGARALLRGLFRESGGRYGYRRMNALLRAKGVRISEKVVRRIMRQEGLVVRYEPKRPKWSSYAGENGQAPPNLVARNFRAALPGNLWLTDITQFNLPSFRCYLSPVIDCFDGKVVSWRASERPDAALVNGMLDDAVAALRAGERPVVHSDRGAHYRWPGWIERCEAAGLVRSMSKKGCSPDNSACEGFFGRLKNEFFYHRSWEGVGMPEFVEELGAYIDWYNDSRIKESLGWMSPNAFRRSLGLAA